MNIESNERIQGRAHPSAGRGEAPQKPGRRSHASVRRNQAGELQYNEPVVKNVVRERWVRKAGMQGQVAETREVFGTDRVFRGSSPGRDLVEESGNRLTRGILHNIQLGKDTGESEIERNPFVQNNNMLETWKQAGTTERREIIIDTAKTPAERRAEALKPPQEGVDLQA